MWDAMDWPFRVPGLSIDTSSEDHQKWKAVAAPKGQSTKDCI